MIRVKPILRVLGVLLIMLGGLMWTGLLIAHFYKSGDGQPIFYSGAICLGLGLPIFLFLKDSRLTLNKREGYLIVALGWFTMVSFSMLPYLISGVIPTIPEAFFEAVSGMTTTGASVLTDIESVSKGILYWRSLTQWIGGMGIIVLTVAIFPLLGIGGIELFVAEAPGPTSDKLHPRIQETAKRLWAIYVFLTIILCIILNLVGMDFYDSVNHALTTMATGGFSTKNASMAHFDVPAIQYSIIFFMFLAGTNYTIIYYGLKGKIRRVWYSDEFKTYVILVLTLAVIVTAS
ncbi:MAG: TrkH family potassium uptake protein, partial [Bacteroidetes bacterium]